ncbi:hypothetical protein HDU80_002407, partial [Chytriomyces hyalinus]
ATFDLRGLSNPIIPDSHLYPGDLVMDATPVATFTMVKTTQAGAAIMVKSTGDSSSPGPSTKTELSKLPAYADAGDFTSWLRQYLLVAEQKFGSGEELYILFSLL